MAQSAWRQLKIRFTVYAWSPGCVTVHLGAYLVVSCGLLLTNVVRTPSELWFWRPMLVLGLLLALHAAIASLVRCSIRLPAVRLSLAPLSAVWTRLQPLIDAWTAPQLSIISRPTLFIGNDAPAPSVPAQPPTPAPAAPEESWPTWPPASETSRPEPSSAWAASWPAARVEPPAPSVIRPTGIDTVLNGAQIANPERPNWKELEVAAATWLAARSSDLDHQLPR